MSVQRLLARAVLGFLNFSIAKPAVRYSSEGFGGTPRIRMSGSCHRTIPVSKRQQTKQRFCVTMTVLLFIGPRPPVLRRRLRAGLLTAFAANGYVPR